MKIAFDAKRYYHNNTGLGNYSRTIVGGLQRLYPDNSYVLYDARTLPRTFSLAHRARREGCDIFHGLSNELPLRLPDSMPTVVTMHDVAWRTFPDMYHAADRVIYDFKYGRACRNATHVIAISESTKRDVMRFYGVPEENISVIYQPVQEFYYTPLSADETETAVSNRFGGSLPDDFILYVGSINSRKNLIAVIDALAMLKPDNRPFLLVVGNGRAYRTLVEQRIEQYGLRNSVAIATDIHNNTLLQALYAKARLFVYPSFYEGFGLPVVEAALQQTPVITTTVSSLPEAAGPDACLINPHSSCAAEQMAHHIARLTADDSLNRHTGKAMEQYARTHFDPTMLTHRMMHLYRRLTGNC